MTGFRRARRLGRIVAILAVLWAAASGTAHRGAAAPLDPALAAFLQMGGALSDLCGDGHDPDDHHPRCDVCRNVGPALPPTGFAWCVARAPGVAWAARGGADAVARPGLRAGPGLRGPPVGFV